MNANTAIIEIGQFSLESAKLGTRRWLLGEHAKHRDEDEFEDKFEDEFEVSYEDKYEEEYMDEYTGRG